MPRGALALLLAVTALAVLPRHAHAALPIIECNEMTVGQPCDTDDTVCTVEKCVRIGASVECKLTGNAADGTACESDAQPCTIDACGSGTCGHTPLPVGTVCIDGLFCTDGETCDAAGICGGGQPTCDDHNMCTTDTCDEAANSCANVADVVCAPDGNSCTSDTCDPAQGCNYAPEPPSVACDDGRFCTIADHCDGEGNCTGGLNCLDTNACTVDTCDEATDTCENVADVGAACDDANACTSGDACNAAAVCAGAPVPDTTVCSASGGCLVGGLCVSGTCVGGGFAPDGTACDDADDCSVGETCQGGSCGGATPLICDDGDACTIDGCAQGQGCVAAPIMACMPPDAGVPDAGPPADAGPVADGGPDVDGGLGDGGPVGGDGGVRPDGAPFLIEGDLGGGGCGCTVGGAPRPGSRSALPFALAALVALVGLGMLRRRRRRVALAALAAVAVLLAASPRARAEGFDAQLFKPTTSTTGFIGQEGETTLPDGILQVRLTADVASDLLILRDPDTGMPVVVTDPNTGEVISSDGRVLARRSNLTLGAAYGLGSRLELSLALPLAVAQTGNLRLVNRAGTLSSTALGDLRLGAKVRLFGESSFGVAGALGIVVPTGDADAFAGAGTFVVTPRLVAGVQTGRVALAANAGYALRKAGGAGNLAVDDEVLLGAGVSVNLVPGLMWALADAYTRIGVQGSGSEREMPAETLFALRWHAFGPWMIEGGAGFGLTHGYGAPKVRGLISLSYAPTPEVRRALPPDTEVVMEEDKTPPPPPPPDRDKDGIPDDKDACPDEPEDMNGVKDDDGCPDADQDGDGILDKDDKCPTEKEVVNGVDDQDGCPDEGLFELKEDRIVLEERVLFDTERARVKTGGKKVLKAVVVLWGQHPEYEKMIIEGHTDARGTEEYNQKLGLRRAEAVRDALVAQGFPADKIEIVSYGRSRPVDTSKTQAAYQKNRRTEFVIVRTTKTAVPPPATQPTPPATDAPPAAPPDAPQH